MASLNSGNQYLLHSNQLPPWINQSCGGLGYCACPHFYPLPPPPPPPPPPNPRFPSGRTIALNQLVAIHHFLLVLQGHCKQKGWPIQGFAESLHSSNQSEIVCTAVVQAFVLLSLPNKEVFCLPSLSFSERHSELHPQGMMLLMRGKVEKSAGRPL